MTQSEIEARCRKVLALQLGLVEIEQLLPGEDLAEAGLVDSLDAASITAALEEEFGCDLPDDALAYSPYLPWTVRLLVEVVTKALEVKEAVA